MKHVITKQFIVFSALIFECFNAHAQTMVDFQKSMENSEKSLQAVHKYPPNIEKGKCHNVEITKFTVYDNHIKIVEKWKNWAGNTANTVLTGTIVNEIAEGEWKSDYSSGSWSYNFKSNTGKWNKTKAPSVFGKPFEKMEYLLFMIVNKDQIRDGFFDCN